MSDDSPDVAAAIRAEWRAEETAWSQAALERWEHGRTLADVVRDCMHRGDVATFAFAAVTWSGALVAVGDDIATLDVGGTRVDVGLRSDAPFVLRIRPVARGDGRRGEATVTTFAARLRELDGTYVVIGTPDGALEGMMRVGRDQVRITDGDGHGHGHGHAGAAYVPMGSLMWVRTVDVD